MRILAAGATGFLGRPLVERLAAEGHAVTVLSRRPERAGLPGSVRVLPWGRGDDGTMAAALDGCDALVNLAGESIAGGRWTAARKRAIVESRVGPTRRLAEAAAAASRPPAVFIAGSAVGYYGPRGDEFVTERDGPGTGFLAATSVEWEAAAAPAASSRTRVVYLRTGLVLGRGGGALAPMLLPFRLGLGGPIGSGRQFWPWIDLDDWVAIARWALEGNVTGPVNATGPEPVTCDAFTRALAAALRRPCLLRVPAFAVRLALGEMGEELLLAGQRAVPEAALAGGFTFRSETVDRALARILGLP